MAEPSRPILKRALLIGCGLELCFALMFAAGGFGPCTAGENPVGLVGFIVHLPVGLAVGFLAEAFSWRDSVTIPLVVVIQSLLFSVMSYAVLRALRIGKRQAMLQG